MRSWRKRSATKWAKAPYNTVEATFVLKKITKIISNTSKQQTISRKFHWNKIGQIQSEENDQEGKQEESRAKVGQIDVNDREKLDL